MENTSWESLMKPYHLTLNSQIIKMTYQMMTRKTTIKLRQTLIVHSNQWMVCLAPKPVERLAWQRKPQVQDSEFLWIIKIRTAATKCYKPTNIYNSESKRRPTISFNNSLTRRPFLSSTISQRIIPKLLVALLRQTPKPCLLHTRGPTTTHRTPTLRIHMVTLRTKSDPTTSTRLPTWWNRTFWTTSTASLERTTPTNSLKASSATKACLLSEELVSHYTCDQLKDN